MDSQSLSKTTSEVVSLPTASSLQPQRKKQRSQNPSKTRQQRRKRGKKAIDKRVKSGDQARKLGLQERLESGVDLT